MFYRSMALIIGMPARFQDVIETNQIRFDISIRINDGISDACLGSEIHNDLRLVLFKYLIDQFLIRNTAFNKNKGRMR